MYLSPRVGVSLSAMYWALPIVPKKLQSAFGYRLRKNPLWNQKNQTGL